MSIATATAASPVLDYDRAIADRVAQALRQARISQVRVARVLRVHQTYISRRLTGAVPFTVDELAAIAQLLGRPVGDLMVEPEPDQRYCINSLSLDFEEEPRAS